MYLAETVSQFSRNGSIWLTWCTLAGVSLLVAAAVPRRRALTALAGCGLALILGLTLVPNGGWGALGFESGALRSIVTNLEPHRSALVGWWRNPDGPANVVLYVPAGLFVAWLSRRPLLTAVGLTAMSVVIEAWQSTLTTRIGSFDDVVANGLGAVLGAAAAAVVSLLARVTRRPVHAGTAAGYGARR